MKRALASNRCGLHLICKCTVLLQTCASPSQRCSACPFGYGRVPGAGRPQCGAFSLSSLRCCPQSSRRGVAQLSTHGAYKYFLVGKYFPSLSRPLSQIRARAARERPRCVHGGWRSVILTMRCILRCIHDRSHSNPTMHPNMGPETQPRGQVSAGNYSFAWPSGTYVRTGGGE